MGAGTGAILPAKGSAKAWMAHLDLLRFVIASGPETALIIEDDVDWDVEIKSQMRLVSDNVREYMHAAPDDPTPFGTEWDVLWLGHCGALAMNLDGSAMEVDPLLYPDETRSKFPDECSPTLVFLFQYILCEALLLPSSMVPHKFPGLARHHQNTY